MARGRSSFKQQDVTRAARGLVAAGIAVCRVEIDRDGKIILITKAEAEPADGQPKKSGSDDEIIL